VVALLAEATFPPDIAYWYIIHPFIHFWRKLGLTVTYLIVIPLLVAMGYGIVMLRDGLLYVEYGTNYFLWPPAVLSYSLAGIIEVRCRKHLKVKSLIGLPELAPERSKGELLSEGIYGKVRHPRYISVLFGLLAMAFFANYLAIYVLTFLVSLALYAVAVLEERELEERFGQAYVEYCKRVPRFIPRKLPR
jgi:protein-S-isoprenylcysteine O-methyltransferase Ste14